MKRKIKNSVPVNLPNEVISVKQDSPKPTNGKSKTKIHTASVQFSDELDMVELLKVLSAVKNGDFSARMAVDRIGVSGKICDTLNEIISLNETFVQDGDKRAGINQQTGRLTPN